MDILKMDRDIFANKIHKTHKNSQASQLKIPQLGFPPNRKTTSNHTLDCL